jgi:hypothetical protein
MWAGCNMYNNMLNDIGYLHIENKLCVYTINWGMVLTSYCEMAWPKDMEINMCDPMKHIYGI